MRLLCQVSQLAHIAKDRHTALTFCSCQNLQRRRYGLRVGVVAVIQQDPAIG